MIYTYDGTNSSCNLTTAAVINCCDMLFYLKQTLKQAGWTVTRSSDGLTLNSTGDQITGYGTGAGGMNNASAWFVVKAPGAVAGSTRQFLFQRPSSNANCISMWYSQSAGFTGGAAATAPTATDSQLILNTTGFSNNALYRYSIAADNAAPYGFYMFNFTTSTGTPTGIIVYDPLESNAYDPTDTDPYIIYAPSNNGGYQSSPGTTSSLTSETLNTGLGAVSWYRKGSADQSFGLTTALEYQSAGIAIPGGLSTNPYTSNDEIFPILFARRNALLSGGPVGYKGISSIMKWVGTTGRSTGDTISVSSATSKEYIIYANIALPWNGTTPTI